MTTATAVGAGQEAQPAMLARATSAFAPFAPTVLRVVAGFVFLVYGLNKVGNPSGFEGFVTSLGFPAPTLLAWLVIGLETVGGAALIAGLLVRPIALLFALEMIVTSVTVKLSRGIAPEGATGIEIDLALFAISVALLLLGAGRLSIDRDVLRRELI